MNRWDKIYEEGVKYKTFDDKCLNKLLIEIKKHSKRTPTTMIDLGCGTGDLLVKFIKKGFNVTGVDFSRVALRKAEDNLNKFGFKAELIQMDLNKLDINKKSDIIFCKLTFAFIKDKINFLKMVKRMMYKHSFFVLITPILRKGIVYTKEDKPGIAVDFDELTNLLNSHFVDIKIFNYEFFGKRGKIATFLLTK